MPVKSRHAPARESEKPNGGNAMARRIKAIALVAIVLAYSTTADAVAWKASGYYHFWMSVEEIGFKGEAYLEYSGRLTPALIQEGLNNEGALTLPPFLYGLQLETGHF